MKPRQVPERKPPLQGALVRSTAMALAGALMMLYAAAVRAEDGKTPGLTELAQAAAKAKPAGVTAAPAGRVVAGASTPQPRNYKIDSEDFSLRPGEGVEFKYHMQKGAVMVYGWNANGKLCFEFHGEPDQKPNPEYYESYEVDAQVGKEQSYGSFTAPTTGIHGWFWQNKTDKEVEFHLTTAGFYDSAKMFAGGAPEEMPVEEPK